MTAHAETILGQMSRCGKRLETFTLTHCWGTSALGDGFEALGFEVLVRVRGGLRDGVGTDLNAKILVRVGGDDEGRTFLWYHLDCVFRWLQMGPGIVVRHSLCCTRRNGHIGFQSQRTGSEIDSQPEAVKASGLFPGRRFRIVSVLPTTRKLARPVNTSAFIGTYSQLQDREN
jgi:hypothetical protein